MARSRPHTPKAAWKESDKIRAVSVYRSVNTVVKTSEITGIPERTLFFWMKEEWWKEKINAFKSEDSAQLEDAATHIAKHALENVEERLANGDHILGKDGQLVRKPVSAKDAAIIAAVAIDKRKLLQEEPVREQRLATDERLLRLVEQFARFASAKEIKGVVKRDKDSSDSLQIDTREPEIEVEEVKPDRVFQGQVENALIPELPEKLSA